MAESHPYLRVDVFCERPLLGNPLVVFPDADRLDTGAMQAIAREMNLSETVFCLAATQSQADLRLRIFTVDRELPLAGHPTIGAVHALATSGRLQIGEGARDAVVWCELAAGVLPVEIEGEAAAPTRIVMTQRRPSFGEPLQDLELVSLALGLPVQALAPADLPTRVADTGVAWLIVPVVDLPAMRRIQPDPVACRALAEQVGTEMIYAFTQDVEDHHCTAHARHVWFGSVTPGEDPATGSAAGGLAAYLVHEDVLMASPDVELSIEQGLEIGRPSRIDARITKRGGRVDEVKVGGSCVTVGDGRLTL